ncbi:MAG: outer membrane beta-barrel protein [Bacteroidota bacterium]
MKNTLIVLLALFTCGTLQAQFGIKLGGNLSAVGSYGNAEEGESVGLKPGYQAGIFYHAGSSNPVGFLVELNYEARGTISKKDYSINLPIADPSGTRVGIGDFDTNQEANARQSYINLPLLVTFGGERVRFYAGPNIGYLVSATADFDRTIEGRFENNPSLTTNLELEDVDFQNYESFKEIFITEPAEDGDFVNSLEFGLNAGAMLFLGDQLFLDLRIS